MRLTSTFLFLATALVGVLVAYDQPLALRRFGLIALGILLVALLVWVSGTGKGEAALGYAAYLSLWAAGAIAVIYLFAFRQASSGSVCVRRDCSSPQSRWPALPSTMPLAAHWFF